MGATRKRGETYARLIGYHFGDDKNGNSRLYDGAYWNPDTKKKQYCFIYVDAHGQVVGQEITDYKGFRAIIDCYSLP